MFWNLCTEAHVPTPITHLCFALKWLKINKQIDYKLLYVTYTVLLVPFSKITNRSVRLASPYRFIMDARSA